MIIVTSTQTELAQKDDCYQTGNLFKQLLTQNLSYAFETVSGNSDGQNMKLQRTLCPCLGHSKSSTGHLGKICIDFYFQLYE